MVFPRFCTDFGCLILFENGLFLDLCEVDKVETTFAPRAGCVWVSVYIERVLMLLEKGANNLR